jgi:hypothetical protein
MITRQVITAALFSSLLVTVFCITGSVQAAQIRSDHLTFQINQHSGIYILQSQNPAMTFQGTVGTTVSKIKTATGHDRIGSYQSMTFQWHAKHGPLLQASIRLYDHQPAALLAMRFLQATEHPQMAFPDFSSMPKAMHVFSYSNHYFSPPQFRAGHSGTPWLLFDDHLNAAVISPASHFLITTMRGNGVKNLAVSLNAHIPAVPSGYRISSLLVITHGINAAWDLWGHTLTNVTGKIRPSNEADWALRYLGYWTSNGCGYFCHFDPKLGYAGTLVSEIKSLHDHKIPVRYLQLDGWWGNPSNGITSNRNYFPDGLKAFHQQLGIPIFIYAVLYGNNVADLAYQRYWDQAAASFHARGGMAYEEDWLSLIYKTRHLDQYLKRGDRFFKAMAQAMAAQHMSILYCMARPDEMMQASKYSIVTTSRVSNDFFIQPRWRDFVFTSRLAAAVGLWPWSDACLSTSRYGILLQTLSAGMVGFGDLRGHENRARIMPAVRADGVLVKPDVPLVPTGQSYLNQVLHPRRPIIARTYTQQQSVRTVYVFAFDGADMARIPQRMKVKSGTVADGYLPRKIGYTAYFVPVTPFSKILADYHRTVKFFPARMGLHDTVYVYNYFTHQTVKVPAGREFVGRLGQQRASFYICAQTGPSGIAFLGDLSQYVGTGKARIPYLANRSNGVSATVAFAKGEKAITLSGYAKFKPKVKTLDGVADTVLYTPATSAWSVTISPTVKAKNTRLDGQPVKEVDVRISRP